jgi:hypothetical protein
MIKVILSPDFLYFIGTANAPSFDLIMFKYLTEATSLLFCFKKLEKL